MKTATRCKVCRKMQTLPMHPDHYKARPSCRACGGFLRPDQYKNITRRVRKHWTCECDGYKFIHQKASTLCKYTVDGEYKDGPVDDMPGIIIEEF